MKKLFILLIVLVVFLFGCISRTNPLDPNANPNIIVPQKVTGLQLTNLSPTTVRVRWDKRGGVSGYYIYRSMSVDGEYIRVDNGRLNDQNYQEFLDENPSFISKTYYWYKISAYKTYDGKNLEGYRSEPVFIYIQ